MCVSLTSDVPSSELSFTFGLPEDIDDVALIYVVSYECNYCRRSLSLRDRRGLNNVKKREKKAIASEKETLCKHLKH